MSMAMSGGIGIVDQTAVAVRAYRQTADSVFVEAELAHRRALRARRPLLWVAATHSAAAAVAVVSLCQTGVDPATQLLAAGVIGVSAAFWAVWAWSAVAPLPAAVVGLVMYASVSVAAAGTVRLPVPTLPAWAPESIGPAVTTIEQLVPIVELGGVAVVLALLFRAVTIATAARRLPGADVPATGVVPAVLLYLVLLFAVAHRAASADDLLLTMRIVALAVVAAALIGWRTVAGSVARAGGTWLVAGVLMGLGSFALASLYLDGMAAAFGLSTGTGVDPWVAGGYGWAGAAAATVIFPAVFEELAFRGLILPRLARVLGGGEAVFVSAVMFAVLHLNPLTAPFLLPMGIGLGILRRRSGSLWPCVLMHLTHNAAALAVAHWL